MLTFAQVRQMYASKGYKFYETGKFNINIFGIRKSVQVDAYNDTIGIAYIDESGAQVVKEYVATTDPGLYWLKDKLGNKKGTFILAPGFFPKCWTIGKHKGEYPALVQASPGVFKGWRDADGDGVLDMTGSLVDDVQGLNLHTTSHLRGKAQRVGAYSAACQVIQHTKDHDELMSICNKSAELYGAHFSYALFSGDNI